MKLHYNVREWNWNVDFVNVSGKNPNGKGLNDCNKYESNFDSNNIFF